MINFSKKFLRIITAIFSCALLAASCAGTQKDLSPADLQSRKNLAASYARGGDFVNAIREIDLIEKQTKNDHEAYLIKGIAYFGLKDFDAAEKSYKKSLAIKSDYTKARYNLCGLYVKMKKPDGAIDLCSAVARDIRYPLRYAALVNIAKAYEMKGDAVSAERFMKRSIEIEPENIYSRNEYGKLLVKLAREKEAERHFKTALKLAPGHNEARLNLAVIRIKTGDLERACADLRQIIFNKPLPEIAAEAEDHIEKSCNN